ncbi:cadherin-related family member 2 [Polymixia lowei]
MIRLEKQLGVDAFDIIAVDADNDPLIYALTGPSAIFFSVNRENGTNTAVGTSLFKVHATDADTGVASLVKYSIDDVIPNSGMSLFSIMDTTGDVTLSGNLSYTTLSTFYRLRINASDGGGTYLGQHVVQSSIAFAFINVLDVRDLDPRFLRLPYTASVEEGSPLGTSVVTVTAIDQDTGINDAIIYSIDLTGSKADDLFSISQNEGIITVKADIDREVIGDAVTLTVKATEAERNIFGEQAITTAEVQITIIDVNDNKPEFYICGDTCVKQSDFTGEIFEHSSGTIPINMTVKDMDQRGQIHLMLEGADMDVFSVTPTSTISESAVQLMVKDPQKLDFEIKELMVVQVIAVDQEDTSLRSTATVTIKIKDTNDNSPKFPQDTYKIKVAEHSPAGEVIANITAKDLDKIDEGKITYKLLPDSILKFFDVVPDTGIVYVKNSTLIDREASSLYVVTLQARDTNNNTGTTVLEILLTDINDQPPVINREFYAVFVEEGEQFELRIQATDADDPDTENGQIVFGIRPSRYSDNFTIDPDTGVLRNNGALDREDLDPELKGKIELNVTATDKGTPAKSTSVKVIINVEDINDNTPEFKESSYSFSVNEGEKGAFVGLVQAEDLDQTIDYNRISYSIINGSFGSFVIRSIAEDGGYRGNITVDRDIELDYESVRNSFTLWVEAADLDQKTAVMVKVKVLDVNDERPQFKPVKPVTVKENTTIAGAVGRFTAEDRDGNNSLIYELVSIKCRCNSTLQPCDWFVLDSKGEVTVNTEHTVDYELCDQAIVEAQVVDEYTEKGQNNSVTSGEMVINIEDINDNAPEFIVSDAVFVMVSETAGKGKSVAGVTAMDRDSGINKQIEFKVTKVEFHDINNHTSGMRTLFEAVTTQQREIYVGIIQSLEELDSGLRGKYMVTVAATDTGDLSTTTVLEIFTVDKSFKTELRFASPVNEVTNNLNGIILALTAATKAAVEVLAIREDTSQSRGPGDTIMEAYFVYSNGTAVNSDAVEKMLSDPEHFLTLGQFGLTYIGNVAVDNPETDPVMYILLGLVGGLVIVLAVLTTFLVCTRRNYKTKLKAAKAMKSVAMGTTENQKSGPVVPGTNKYTMEGANPVLNLNIDTATDLGFDEESSNVDRLSLNSLDDNMDMAMSEKDITPMMVIQEEEEDNGKPYYSEPLGEALARRGMKKDSASAPLAFDNPALSTTDL